MVDFAALLKQSKENKAEVKPQPQPQVQEAPKEIDIGAVLDKVAEASVTSPAPAPVPPPAVKAEPPKGFVKFNLGTPKPALVTGPVGLNDSNRAQAKASEVAIRPPPSASLAELADLDVDELLGSNRSKPQAKAAERVGELPPEYFHINIDTFGEGSEKFNDSELINLKQAFLELLAGIEDKEAVRFNIRNVMLQLQGNPALVDILLPDHVQTMVRGLRNSYAMAIDKKVERKAKKRTAAEKTDEMKDIIAGMDIGI